MTDVLDVLIAARAEVEKGWAKGAYEYPGGVCIYGALYRTAGLGFEGIQRMATLGPLFAQLPDGFTNLVFFNDDPDTTKADVLALFDRAIAAEAVNVTADPAHVHAVQG
jgi:hypothetical protein